MYYTYKRGKLIGKSLSFKEAVTAALFGGVVFLDNQKLVFTCYC